MDANDWRGFCPSARFVNDPQNDLAVDTEMPACPKCAAVCELCLIDP